MSDSSPIQPTPPVAGVGSVQPVRPEHAQVPGHPQHEQKTVAPAASTGGNLRGAYAQFIVDADSREVVVQIRDSATNEVLSELPSKEVQAMSKQLKEYADALARRRAALQGESAS
jgi:FlaG protein